MGVKIGLQYAKPLSFAGARFMLSGLFLIPFCGKPSFYLKHMMDNIKPILLVAFFQTFLLYGTFYTGMTMVEGALGAIVVGSSPLFAALISHFLMHDDKMTPRKSLSIGLGIFGVVFISISRKPWSPGGVNELFGVLLLILGTISSAFGNVIFAKNRTRLNSRILTSSQIFFGGFFLFLISIPFEGLPHWTLSLSFMFVFGWLSLLSAVAFSIWFAMLKRPDVRVSELNIWKFVIPVFGALFSWLLLTNESPSVSLVIGMVCVSTSIIAFNLCLRFRQ